MGVAIDATEQRIVRRIGMAVITGGPLSTVCSRIDRELMVEGGTRPGRCGVAGLTCFGKSSREVIRIGYCFISRTVAAVAVHGSPRVTPSHMAARARDRGMSTRQRETRFAVVKNGSLPLGSAMASLAIRRKSCGAVIWIRRGIEIFKMARNT